MSSILMVTGTRPIPEAISVEIIARLPLRSIARFKTVCKKWRSVIESLYFRRLFVSLHKKSSSPSSWSLMFPSNFGRPITEAIGFHGCKTWGLSKSLGSYIMPFKRYPNLPPSEYYYVDSSHGLVWIEVIVGTDYMSFISKSFVGNPVLQDWVEIPAPPDHHTIPTSLVTRVGEDGVVSSFKLVRACNSFTGIESLGPPVEWGTNVWKVYVYSSETGTWTFKRLFSSCRLERTDSYIPVNLNGKLYLWERNIEKKSIWEKRDDDIVIGVLVAHDLYAEEADAQSWVIPLPVPDNKFVRRCLTTSGGDIIYIEVLYRRLKVWKLKNNNFGDGEWWDLSREEINMASVGFDVNCFPLGMDPFDTDIVYLWSRQHGCLVSGNLRTQEFTIHQESETWGNSKGCWRINTSDSRMYMEAKRDASSLITLSQFVLPDWMDPVPRLPN